MPNHVHLLLQVAKPEILKKIMCGLNLSYTRYFNFTYTKVGHLWQGRYKSKIIDQDEYFIECIKYIEANPVRAALAENISDYPWNSYSHRTKQDSLLDDLSIG